MKPVFFLTAVASGLLIGGALILTASNVPASAAAPVAPAVSR